MKPSMSSSNWCHCHSWLGAVPESKFTTKWGMSWAGTPDERHLTRPKGLTAGLQSPTTVLTFGLCTKSDISNEVLSPNLKYASLTLHVHMETSEMLCIGVARIFTAGVHFIFTSKTDDLFSHHPQYTGYLPKLTAGSLLHPIKNFFKIWLLTLPGGGGLSTTYPSKLSPKNFQFSPWGWTCTTAPPGYVYDDVHQ